VGKASPILKANESRSVSGDAEADPEGEGDVDADADPDVDIDANAKMEADRHANGVGGAWADGQVFGESIFVPCCHSSF
jgi:hypothetical protein